MSSTIRIIILSILVAIAAWFLPQVQDFKQSIYDKLDSRPARNILFIGNSRTFYHDMPLMVRKIADSAAAKEKYLIKIHAPGGVRFEDHWNDPVVQSLLKQKWDYVVLQGRSNEQQNYTANASFLSYGAKLIREAQISGSKPVLYVTWRYDDGFELYNEIPALQHTLYGLIQSNYELLANDNGISMVNVGKAWEVLRSYHPTFPLYEDGNHPTIYGSYLAALMFYKYFSGSDVTNVSYVPDDISSNDAKLIKKVANGKY